jgi:hypothetical protein
MPGFVDSGIKLVGVEITSDAKSVADEPFEGPTALFMGNEGHGLTEAQKEACDSFVYIPQFGDGTASLNVSVAAAIVMHRFASWAKYEEHRRDDGVDKFTVSPLPDPKTRPRTAAELALREARAAAKAGTGAEEEVLSLASLATEEAAARDEGEDEAAGGD